MKMGGPYLRGVKGGGTERGGCKLSAHQQRERERKRNWRRDITWGVFWIFIGTRCKFETGGWWGRVRAGGSQNNNCALLCVCKF